AAYSNRIRSFHRAAAAATRAWNTRKGEGGHSGSPSPPRPWLYGWRNRTPRQKQVRMVISLMKTHFPVTLLATPFANSTSTATPFTTTASKVDATSPLKYAVSPEVVTSTFLAPFPMVNFL